MQVTTNAYHELALAATGEAAEIWIALLGQAGFDTFLEEELHLLAYVPTAAANSEQVTAIIENVQTQPGLFISWAAIPPQNWNQTWEDNFEPVRIDNKLYIRAAHHAPDPTAHIELLIQPKMSFGTGHHATTRQVAAYQLSIDHKGKTILDAGCGTGILAILAEKLGAAHVFAFDHEDWAAENAAENTVLNHCSRIQVAQAELDSYLPPTKADGILANITRNLVIVHMPAFAQWLQPSGWLLVSGFYIEDLPAVQEAAAAAGFRFEDNTVQDRWCAARFTKA